MTNSRREWEKVGEVLSDHAQARHYARAKESILTFGRVDVRFRNARQAGCI